MLHSTPPAFLPILRLLQRVFEYKETSELLVTIHWSQRNQRATNHRSHLALIPIDKLFPGRGDILVYMPKSSSEYIQSDDPFGQTFDNLKVVSLSQRRPGPHTPQWKIPVSEWANVVRRIVENQEPLRKVAGDYGVSHETVRRVINAVHKRKSSSIMRQELESQIEFHPTSYERTLDLLTEFGEGRGPHLFRRERD